MANVGFRTKRMELFLSSDAWEGVVDDRLSCRHPFGGLKCMERAGLALGKGVKPIIRTGRRAGRQEGRHARANDCTCICGGMRYLRTLG